MNRTLLNQFSYLTRLVTFLSATFLMLFAVSANAFPDRANLIHQTEEGMQFNGQSYTEIPHDSEFLTDDGTIAFWVTLDSIGQQQGLWSKDSGGFDSGGHMSVSVTADGHLHYRLQSTTESYEIYSNTHLVSDRPYHIALVFGDLGMQLYVNGIQESAVSYTHLTLPTKA